MQDVRPNPRLPLPHDAGQPIFTGFLEQAERSAQAPAIVSQEGTCTYRALEAISRGIAAFLIESGVRQGDRIVIVSSRCAGLVYAMLGASRAGAIFTVADMAYPKARIAQIIRTLRPAFILLGGAAQVELDDASIQVERVPEPVGEALSRFAPYTHALPSVDPGQPAYITFTSGSTGEPKGVVTTHAPLVHFIGWHVRQHGFSQDDCFSLLSGLGHDPVYRDVFTPLSIGARVAIPSQATVIDPAALAAWLQAQEVSVVHLTPPLGKLIETGARLEGIRLDALRYLFWGGEALGSALYGQIREVAPNACSVNFYGTTETPQAMAYHRIDPAADNSRIPLGKGIDGAQLLVVDDAHQLAGEGQVGEILIRSPYLSEGYWGDAAQTHQRYVPNPFTQAEDDVCYRTGDLGSYRADGSVIFLGRGDSQVKIRGHRIELVEIEGVLARHPQVKQCVVLADTDGPALKLVAYCVASSPVASLTLREHVASQLPDYMVPALFVMLEAIPITPNGKVDKRALLALRGDTDTGQASEALSPVALRLVSAWSEILQTPDIDPNLSFVELGGDSLSFVQASMVLETLIGPLPAQWELKPIHELCQLSTTRPTAKPVFRAVEIPVLLRVLSILLIVIGHFHGGSGWPIVGETSVLFAVSGLALARFQLKAIDEYGSVRTLLRSIAVIVVPTLLYTLLTQVVFGNVHWQAFLLIANWYPPAVTGGFSYWYIELLVQMLAIMAVVLSFARVRAVIMAAPFRVLLVGACAAGVAGFLINAYVFDASALYNRVPQHYLAVLVLGMAIHFARTTPQKWLASGAVVLVLGGQRVVDVVVLGVDFSQYIDVAIPAVLAMIWWRAVPLPDLIARGAAVIASSTLFIYLTHYQFQSVARRLGDVPGLDVALAVVVGIVVAYAWNKAVRFVSMRWNGGAKRSADKLERVL
ncbi:MULTISPECIES: amino acid adenylation domain-containing protein [Pseudomonas]|uniref:amino acid adenylation domain-containing protein n=1 Tax=Pseudomonas TaxID=286 RepID=UPI00211834B5|nr:MULTISPECIES: amino acid adenylation domain-containing protein [Pseudomonas]